MVTKVTTGVLGTLTELNFADNGKAKFGAGSDLQIYHNGSNASIILDNNSGSDLLIQSNNIVLEKPDGENMIHCAGDGAVQLYHNGSSKLATTATGINVTGTIQADNLTMLDNEFIRLGNSNDLQIFCDGTDGYIRNHVSGGSIYNRAYTNWIVQTNASDGGADDAIRALRNGAVELYHDGNKKLETTSGGATITGTLNGFGLKAFGTASLLISEDGSTGTLNAAHYNTGFGHSVFNSLTSGDYNTAIGFGSMGSSAVTGEGNTGLGMYALRYLTSGSGNVAIGWDAAITLQTGTNNVAVGKLALKDIVSGSQNVAIGVSALENFTESYNVAVGYRAMLACSSGERNTAIGYDTMVDLGTNEDNTAVGYNALKIVTGGDNTAIGSRAGDNTTSGVRNVYVGIDAGGGGNGSENCMIGRRTGRNATSSNTTAVGTEALQQNTGAKNSAVGYQCLINNQGGTENTAMGYFALTANVGGNYNTAMGVQALDTLNGGHRNVAVGREACRDQASGSNNTGIGTEALKTNASGEHNTAVGSYALNTSVTGYNNTACGHNAGLTIKGHSNTCIGQGAGESISSGNTNIMIGHNVENNSAGADSNIVIGNDIYGAGANTVRFGTPAGSSTLNLDGSDTSWAAASDLRLKKDVVDSTVGLNFIKDLRPVTFKWNAKNAIANSLPQYDASSSDPVYGVGEAHHGFIAQEVKTVIDAHSDVVDGHNLWNTDPDGTQQVSQGALVPMLVKAIQEQQTIMESLTARIIILEGE